MLAKLVDVLPRKEALTIEWVLYLMAGTTIGYRLREAVLTADPANPLVGLDWGVMLGALLYYFVKFL